VAVSRCFEDEGEDGKEGAEGVGSGGRSSASSAIASGLVGWILRKDRRSVRIQH
jgi:hypothetical protein